MSYFSLVNHAHELVNEVVLWIVLIYVSVWCYVLTNAAKDLGDLSESNRWRFSQRVEKMRVEVLRRSKHDQMVIRICLLACAIIDGVTVDVLFASRWCWLLCLILAVVITFPPGPCMLPNRKTHSRAKGLILTFYNMRLFFIVHSVLILCVWFGGLLLLLILQ